MQFVDNSSFCSHASYDSYGMRTMLADSFDIVHKLTKTAQTFTGAQGTTTSTFYEYKDCLLIVTPRQYMQNLISIHGDMRTHWYIIVIRMLAWYGNMNNPPQMIMITQ